MTTPESIPKLTTEQQQALDAGDGVVQGSSFVLMRTDVVLDWFGYTPEQLGSELDPAIEQADRGEVHEWSVNDFLTRMHSQHAAK